MSFQADSIDLLDAPATGHQPFAHSLTSLGEAAFANGNTSASCGTALGPTAGAKETAGPPLDIRDYPEVDTAYDSERGIYWQWMRPRRRPAYTMELMADAKKSQAQARALSAAGRGGLRYVVTASRVPGVFNLGGDLPHFAELIRAGDRDGLRAYARACIDVQYARATNMGERYVSISLVQGDALGGGFECALADDMIIAEKGAKFGLPEVLFGLFPGMGAYSFLSRRIGGAAAERMILSGRIYSAEELYEMGLVTMLAEPGQGESAVLEFVRRDQRSFRARAALSRIRQRVEPVTWAELSDIAETWVEAALTLGPAELRKMARLAAAQDRRWGQLSEERAAADAPARETSGSNRSDGSRRRGDDAGRRSGDSGAGFGAAELLCQADG